MYYIMYMNTKTCSKCRNKLYIDNFYKRSDRKSGYSSQCKTCASEYYTEWYRSNREKKIQSVNRTNRQIEESKKNTGYYKRPDVKIKRRLRYRIWSVLTGRSHSSLDYIACSTSELRLHLENTAKANGYDFIWDKFGSNYHIDHIIPCSSFDLTKDSEQLKCFHYTNLQILSAKDNLTKGKSICQLQKNN